MTTCVALPLDDRLEAMYRLAEEIRVAGTAALRRPVPVPDWPACVADPYRRGGAAARVGVIAVGALAATHAWTAATWVMGAPPRPTFAPTSTVAAPVLQADLVRIPQ
jgi:hypothetical protein